MSYDLVQSDGRLRFNIGGWRYILYLAQLGGWQPAGTKLDYYLQDPDQEPIDWNGSYLSNEGQFVTDEDAKALADGLDNWLNSATALDIVESFYEEAEAPKSAEVCKCLIDGSLRCSITEHPDRVLLRVMRGEEIRERLRATALFFRRGGFSIY